jgi:hypothetical protein
MTLRTLKTQASKAIKFRGHTGRWSALHSVSAWFRCTDCDAHAYVTTRPPANGIDIGGSAVAVSCDRRGQRGVVAG